MLLPNFFEWVSVVTHTYKLELDQRLRSIVLHRPARTVQLNRTTASATIDWSLPTDLIRDISHFS